MAQLLGLWGPWWCQVHRDMDCLQGRSYGHQSFSISPPVQALRGLPCLGSFSVVQLIRHIEGLPWLGSYSVVKWVRHLMGQPLYCSASDAGLWGEAMVMAPCPMHDSAATSCFHGCLAFLHRHFPPQSPPSYPLNLSLHSQQQPFPWDCSTLPKLQLPATVPSRGPVSLSRVCMAAARTIWFSFHLGCHTSAALLSALNVSPLTQTVALMWGSDPCFSSPNQLRAGPALTLLFFPQFLHPTEFCIVLYILFHWSGTPVCSQLVFCTHFCVWRGIPDVSVERDVLHVHLLLHQLVLPSMDIVAILTLPIHEHKLSLHLCLPWYLASMSNSFQWTHFFILGYIYF